MSQFVPTILIGVGGIGSRIVDQVKAKLPKKTLEFIAFHTFDTNVNDIKNLRHLTSNDITQTSTDITVGEYLNFLEKNGKTDFNDWFPYTNGEILKRSMTEGAGQVRTISRLAFKSAISTKGLEKLMASFNRIFVQRESTLKVNPRVMIVSSLAGGTGAGIFLQVGLLIRSILQERYGKSPLIRGSFILPDVLLNSGKLADPQQMDNLRTNAYACFKELDAFIVANSEESKEPFLAGLEYKPDQEIKNGVYTVSEKPYDFSLLYDFENMNGANLQYFENYENLVIESIYTDLMTPIGDTIYSQQDNRILEIIAEKGRNRYCSSAVSKLSYPYQDIIKLGAYNKVVDDLEDEWLFADELINEEIRNQRASVKTGITLPEVSRTKRFIEIFKVESEKINPKAFLQGIFRSTFIRLTDKFGTEILGPSYADEFIKNIRAEIDRLILRNREIQNIKSQIEGIDPDEFRKKGVAEQSIGDKEGLLIVFKNTINNYIGTAANQLVREILFKDKSKETRFSDTYYTLNYWFLKDEGLHPAAIRLLIYQIIDQLSTLLNGGGMPTLDSTGNRGVLSDCIDLENRIKEYTKAFDDPETDDYIESATDRVSNLLQKRLSFFRNNLKEFAEEYEGASNNQFDNLNQYLTSKFTLIVFERLLSDLQKLAELWENYFNALDAISYEMAGKRNDLLIKHENSNPITTYVFGKKEVKEKLLEEVLPSISVELPSVIKKSLYISLYNRWNDKLDGRKVEVKGEEIRAMIENDLVSNYEKLMESNPSLDMNIVEAIRKEAIYLDIDEEEYMKRLVDQIDSTCLPLVKLSSAQSGVANSIKAWGLSTKVRSSLNNSLFIKLFSNGDAIEHDFFDSKEIIRSLTLFGLKASDLPKFAPTGIYRKAYDRRIAMLNGMVKDFASGEVKKTITPHLDTRWHFPSYLNNIGESKETVYSKANKAMILGLATHAIVQLDISGKFRWMVNADDSPFELKNSMTGEKVAGDFLSLFTELYQNVGLAETLMHDISRESLEEQKGDASSYKNNFIFKGLSTIKYKGSQINMIDVLLMLLDNQVVNASNESKGIQLFNALKNELEDLVSLYKPTLDKKEVSNEVNEIILELYKSKKVTHINEYTVKIDAMINSLKS